MSHVHMKSKNRIHVPQIASSAYKYLTGITAQSSEKCWLFFCRKLFVRKSQHLCLIVIKQDENSDLESMSNRNLESSFSRIISKIYITVIYQTLFSYTWELPIVYSFPRAQLEGGNTLYVLCWFFRFQ